MIKILLPGFGRIEVNKEVDMGGRGSSSGISAKGESSGRAKAKKRMEKHYKKDE